MASIDTRGSTSPGNCCCHPQHGYVFPPVEFLLGGGSGSSDRQPGLVDFQAASLRDRLRWLDLSNNPFLGLPHEQQAAARAGGADRWRVLDPDAERRLIILLKCHLNHLWRQAPLDHLNLSHTGLGRWAMGSLPLRAAGCLVRRCQAAAQRAPPVAVHSCHVCCVGPPACRPQQRGALGHAAAAGGCRWRCHLPEPAEPGAGPPPRCTAVQPGSRRVAAARARSFDSQAGCWSLWVSPAWSCCHG